MFLQSYVNVNSSILTIEEQLDVAEGIATLSRIDSIIVLIVTVFTLLTNLAIAVGIGIVLSLIDGKVRDIREGKKLEEAAVYNTMSAQYVGEFTDMLHGKARVSFGK